MIIIIKLLLFYGGALLALGATVFLWLFWKPELHAHVFCDDTAQTIRCTLQATRTLSPIRLTGIWIPVAYKQALGASPPAGFCEKRDRLTPAWLYDNAKRELLVWSGRLEVPRRQSVEFLIPAKHPRAVSGTLHLFYEYRGAGGVLISCGSVDVPLNGNKT